MACMEDAGEEISAAPRATTANSIFCHQLLLLLLLLGIMFVGGILAHQNNLLFEQQQQQQQQQQQYAKSTGATREHKCHQRLFSGAVRADATLDDDDGHRHKLRVRQRYGEAAKRHNYDVIQPALRGECEATATTRFGSDYVRFLGKMK
uniref:Uncharacterized protein n=1 Tax=Anopheles coluzzii TaxID=1518534 RepID=A0A8W7P4Z2_ANOCL